MATDTTDLKVRFDAEWADFDRGAQAVERQLDRTAKAAERANRDMLALQKQVDDDAAAQWDRQASAMDATGRAMLGFGAAAALGFGYAAKAAIDWESAWAGVTKTVDGSGAQLDRLQSGLRGLATELPTSHEEIAAVAEAAGQLGVERQNIVAFTRTMINLGETTNLSAEDAANGLARFANVMGTSQKDVDRLGSSLVALGNDGASTEAEILEMAQRISGAGKQLDLTEGETLGLASALSSVGINAEAGGSSMSTLLVRIQEAVSEGGGELETFAKVAGVSASEFKRRFGEDAAGAFDLFVRGLGRIKSNGGDTLGVLKQLGITEIRQRDAVLRLAGAGDLLRRSLKLGNSSWKDNTALIKEAEKRYDTTESRAKIAFNTFKDGAIDIGNILLPAIGKVVDTGADLLRFFNGLPGPVKTVGTVVGVTATAIALAGGAALIAAPKIVAFKAAVDGLSAGRLKSAGQGLSRFATLMTGPWGAAIGVGLTALTFFAAKQGDTKQEIDEVTQTLDKQTGAITKNTREWVASKIAEELGDVSDAAETAGVSMDQLAKAAIGDPAALDPLIERYEELNELASPKGSARTGGSALTAAQRDEFQALAKIIGVVESSSGTIAKAQGQFEATKSVTKALGNAADDTAEKQKGANEQWRIGEDVTGDMAGEVETLADAFEELTGATLSEREARRSWFSALRDANAALKENGRTLDVTTEKGSANADALDSIAEASMDALSAMDENGRSARVVTKTFERQHDALIRQAMAFGMSRKEAKAYADRVHQLPASVTTEVKTPGAKESKDRLKDVDDWARQILDQVNVFTDAPGAPKAKGELEDVDKWAREIQEKVNVFTDAPGAPKATDDFKDLDGWVRTVDDKKEVDTSAPGLEGTREGFRGLDRDIRGLNGKKVDVTLSTQASKIVDSIKDAFTGLFNADGNIVDFYSHGDIRDGHQAHMVPAGTYRMFGERETGGEAYIPLAEGKRGRSTQLLDDVAGRFGYRLERYADGDVLARASSNDGRKVLGRIDNMHNDARDVMERGISKYMNDRLEQMQVGFHWPLPRQYGPSGTWGTYASGGSHPALDFPAPLGTPIYAVLPGKVKSVIHMNSSFGNHVEVGHGNSLSSLSAHMQKTLVRPGQVVGAGERIGLVNSTGNSTGDHLHLEMRRNGTSFDYTSWLHGGGPAILGGPMLEQGDVGPGAAAAQKYAKSLMGRYGWRGPQWPALVELWNRESGWNYQADNPSSSAYGIPQGLVELHNLQPPYYGTALGNDNYRGGDPATQINWGMNYIRDRHHSPIQALRFHNANNSYGNGGPVRGPGGPTSDDILAWLSNGEHVWTADEVKGAGGHRGVEGLRAAARVPNGLQGFDSGDSGQSGKDKGKLHGFSGSDDAHAYDIPGAIRSVKDMFEAISKPAHVNTIKDLNRAWRDMAGETRELAREEAQLQRMRDRAKSSAKAVRESEKRLEELRADRDKSSGKVEALEQKVKDARREGGDDLKELERLERDLNRIRKEANKNGKVSKSEQKEIAQAERELTRKRENSSEAAKKASKLQNELNKARRDEGVGDGAILKLRERLRNQRERAKITGKDLAKQENDVAKQRDALSKATQKWREMQQQLIEQAREVSSAITAMGDVFGGAGTSTTAQGLVKKLTGAGDDAEDYGRLLKRVKGRGVDQDIIDQILDQGSTPEALALLRSLAHAPNSLINRINRQQDRLEKLADQTGTWSITPQRHQGGGHNDRGHGGGHAAAGIGRVVNVNINGPVSTTDIKKLGRELENRWSRALTLARSA